MVYIIKNQKTYEANEIPASEEVKQTGKNFLLEKRES